MGRFFRKNKVLAGFIMALVLFLLCSYVSYTVNGCKVDVRTVHEDGHMYVVATLTNPATSHPGGVSIVHSENCPCKR
jgi:hypothetical protein